MCGWEALCIEAAAAAAAIKTHRMAFAVGLHACGTHRSLQCALISLSGLCRTPAATVGTRMGIYTFIYRGLVKPTPPTRRHTLDRLDVSNHKVPLTHFYK